jgi:hypothetical protein
MTSVILLEVLKIIVLASVLFVWVVRYDNIIIEFQQYQLPSWVRDCVGILKVSFVLMLMNQDHRVVLVGSSGIVVFMLAALFTHLRVKNPISKMVPAFTLMTLSLVIFLMTF